jgi:Fur family ferric uptake transcriptional regulator
LSNPSDLKNIGLKATLPRLKILDLFEQSNKRHMTAEEVYRLLSDESQDIGLATVYRVLTQFEQAGLLNQGDHHDHLVCLQCGKVEEFFDAEIEKRQNRIAKERGFAIHDHSLQIYADCIKDNCPNRKTSDPRQR